MSIGTQIKATRENKHLTKSELAKKISVSPAYITMLENGKKTNPSFEVITKIADALVISLDELLNDETTSFSSKLITSILQMDYITISCESDEHNFETISHHTGINMNSLKNCIEQNIELPIEDQLKLIDFWTEWGCIDDGIEFEDFVQQNATKISSNPIISNRIKGMLNMGVAKNDIENLFDLLEKYNFKVSISSKDDQNIISICNNETPIITESESNLVPVYNEIINKINSYSKFIIEDELKKLNK